MRHLFITCFVHFSQICQDNPKTMGTSCLPWQVGVREKFPPQLLPVRFFLPSIFFTVRSMLFSISAHYFCQLRPKPWREKKWMLDNFLSATQEKKRSNVLALVKNDNFSNISVSIMCWGWWPTDRELPESLCLSAFFLYARIKDRL